MRIAIVGTGYVGLVSGACFADFGHHVTCIDKDASKIAALQRGEIPIFEPDLDRLVQSNAKNRRLDFATDLAVPVREADAVFIAVGTPSRRGDGHADLNYVYAASREIATAIDGFTVVITKSTVPVGTGDEVERLIREANPSADVAVASNPEFLREGAAIRDFKFPDRIVVGTHDERARKAISEIYRPLYLNQAPIMFTSRRNAELIKYAANAFLATKITFINEIADLAERVGADVQEIARGIG
jgi:UDPglucose 6-dehydrogenase